MKPMSGNSSAMEQMIAIMRDLQVPMILLSGLDSCMDEANLYVCGSETAIAYTFDRGSLIDITICTGCFLEILQRCGEMVYRIPGAKMEVWR